MSLAMTGSLGKVVLGAAPVIAVLVAAAFVVPPDFPYLERQLILFAVGVGGIVVAERFLFGTRWRRVPTALGFVVPRGRAVAVALIVSLPMWLFLPLYGWATRTPVALDRAWPQILLGVILVNGVAEEVIHRAFVFGHLRRERPFIGAAAISAVIFAAQHAYLVVSVGLTAGSAAIALAFFLAFPLAFLFERGGNSLGAPAILHTSSNAPAMLFVPVEGVGTALLLHMAVVLVSIYLSFAFRRWLGKPSPPATRP